MVKNILGSKEKSSRAELRLCIKEAQVQSLPPHGSEHQRERPQEQSQEFLKHSQVWQKNLPYINIDI